MSGRKTKTTEDRFFEKIEKTDSCWNWIASKYYNGYGQFYQGPNKIVAHRYSYVLQYGKISDEILVCHKCDNRGCVNPEHLFLGSQEDNMQDMVKKGRRVHTSREGINNGRAKVTEEQVNLIRFRYSTENISAKKLGEDFGISESQVLRIWNNQSWRKSNEDE